MILTQSKKTRCRHKLPVLQSTRSWYIRRNNWMKNLGLW
ncbi:hypothetical protein E1A91_D01G209900v1 [Gossypium mustelinum]|uniref:Uncharacterized protein n=1 Tax=Gossypium mustelinum TaxID=34275 RepID=A0A5D2WA41_GOSMU|nr:hypothetical protein E1A91_D01G209900v1 [Gossypium mustelinum]